VRRVYHLQRCVPLALGMIIAVTPIAEVWGHPTVFFPGQAFCPPRTLVVGKVIMQPQQCFSIFLMRTGQGAFLGFAPAGLFFVPPGRIVGLGTPLGVRMRSRILLLLPIAVPVFFVPIDTIRLEAFQVEDLGGTFGVRFAEDPSILVPITPSSPAQGPSRLPGDSTGIPLPTDLHVVSPDPDIPRDEAAFSGRWAGRWRGHEESMANEGLPHLLIVEEITRDDRFLTSGRRVAGVFAWGGSSRWGVFPGWSRVSGVFERGILKIMLPGGGRATYRMGIDGTLDATYESADFGVMRATLSR
jgi:hypothetical protein